jgi:hypothetical protein
MSAANAVLIVLAIFSVHHPALALIAAGTVVASLLVYLQRLARSRAS